MPEPSDLLAVGRIGPAHGVRGDVYVEPWTDQPELRFAPGAVLVTDSELGAVTVTSLRAHGARYLLHVEGIDDRPSAETLRGTQLLIAASDRAPLEDPDDFYVTELVGLQARRPDGTDLGVVRDVLNLPGGQYLALDVDGAERLVPFVASIVPEVDVAGGRVVVDPPDGLFDL